MGCGGSKDKEEGIHASLNHAMRKLELEKLDELFKDAAGIIKRVEELREIIVDNRDDLIIHSGACSVTNPTVMDCMLGICWKLSADNDAKFFDSDLTIDPDAKSLVLKGMKNSKEAVAAIASLNDYFKGIISLPEEMTELASKIQDLSIKFTEDVSSYTTELSDQFSSSPLKIPGKLYDLKENVSKITRAAILAPKLLEELKNNALFVAQELPHLISNAEKLLSIDEKGKKAHTEKVTKAYEIVWDCIDDQKRRFGKKPEEGLKFWDQRKKNKQESKKKLKN